jgi:hypothetical protein
MINEHYVYRTKIGAHEVRFYNMEAGGRYRIHGAIRIDSQWILCCWDAEGYADPAYSMSDGKEWNLIRVRYSPKKEKAVIILSSYPAPIPQRILTKFNGKRVRLTIEEV